MVGNMVGNMKRVYLHLACILLLLFSQQVALAHFASHVHGEPPAQQDGKGKASFQSGLCGLHGAFAQVLGGVGAASPIHSPRHCVAERASYQSDSYYTAAALTPPSRGPPVLL